MRKNSGTLLCLLLGATAGILSGLLFAPASGDNVRKLLTYRVKRYAERLQELIKALAGSNANPSQAKAASQEVINETIQKAQQLLADANDLTEMIEQS